MARVFRRGTIWYAWVPDAGGGTRKVSTNCTDRRAAEKRAVELEREAVDPLHAAANQATTSAACVEFLASRSRRGRSEGTLHHYKVKLGHAVRLLPARLADVDAGACERFIGRRLEEGASQSTVKKELRAIGAALRHARRSGLYERDTAAVIPEFEDDYKPRKRFLTPWELVALCEALPEGRAAHVVFIVATGARWGESERARREDVNGPMVTLRGTKTKASAGVVPVPPPMRAGLSWSMQRARPEGLLFEPWSNVRRDLRAVCAKLGLAPVTPNDLRRTFATWLRIAGLQTDLIGRAMRHTTSRMAELVYGRIEPEQLDRLIAEKYPEPASVPETLTGLLMGGEVAQTCASEPIPETPVSPETPVIFSAQGGNRIPDTGIFNSRGTTGTVEKTAPNRDGWAANGRRAPWVHEATANLLEALVRRGRAA